MRQRWCASLHYGTRVAASLLPLAFELWQDPLAEIGRNDAADTDIATRLAEDGGIDADDLAAHVQQRSARVSRIDGGIGLNEVIVRSRANLTSLGADNAGGDRVIEAERIANGQHPLAYLKPVRISERHS